ncbi:hypothetical protein Dsin_014991 [Dipteronia sinensis]|uniref:FAE domain-containing protein n=1 Tax=Dipteronia sinensis TaxID=43782 RepID=A0AAE0AMU0_9ROSI|nr:hypothetical protein Dsin_014991 [Dipteronia sinensis]
MIINKFGNIKSISLSGMGCSAGILSISLAKDLLKVHKNSLALVHSMEAVSPNGSETGVGEREKEKTREEQREDDAVRTQQAHVSTSAAAAACCSQLVEASRCSR